ncbi:MAG: hypothetical protein ACKO23_16005 [Gemmataceae bacterium]
MTFIGKLLLLVNFAFSLMLAAVAFAAYSSSLDWSDRKETAKALGGVLAPLRADIAEVSKQVAQAQESWKTSRYDLFAREELRRANRLFYQQRLQEPLNSKNPLSMPVLEAPGEIGTQPPRMVDAEDVPGVRLQPYPVYVAQAKQLREENEQVLKELEAKVKEDAELTNQLLGDPEKQIRGLRDQLSEERHKILGITRELGIMEGLRVNTNVQSEIILKRNEAVNERIRELEAFLKAKTALDGKSPVN